MDQHKDKGEEAVEANQAMNRLFHDEDAEGVVDPQTAGTAAQERPPATPGTAPPPD